MSQVGRHGRSFLPITRADLKRLAAIAEEDRRDFFARHSDWAQLYANRLIATALCQGAAMHVLDRSVGINDFDVYSFFAAHPARPWYAKRNVHRDFGVPKFGTSVDRRAFMGRRVDLLSRGIDLRSGEDPADAIRRWLRDGRTESARLLSKKAVVLLSPKQRIGEIVWPTNRP